MEAKIIFLSLLVAACVYAFFWQYAKAPTDGLPDLAGLQRREITIGDKAVSVWVADTSEARSRGLMFVHALGEGEGMLFVFPEAQELQFWNKNTLIDLDVVWLRGGVVTGVSFLPRVTDHGIVWVHSPILSDMVLEAPAGWMERNHLKPGVELR